MPHATARRLLALGGSPPSLERIARRIGLRVIRYTLPEAYKGSYIPLAKAVLLNRAHPEHLQRAMLAEALMHHSLPGHDREAIREGTLHLLAPGHNWPDGDGDVGQVGTLVPLPREHEPPLLWETDAQFNVIWAAPELLDWLGLTFEEVRGRRMSTRLRPGEVMEEVEPALVAATAEVVSGQREAHAAVHRVYRQDGSHWLTVVRVHRAPRGGVLVALVPIAEVSDLLVGTYDDIGRLIQRESVASLRHLPVVALGYALMDYASDGRLDGQIRFAVKLCAHVLSRLAGR